MGGRPPNVPECRAPVVGDTSRHDSLRANSLIGEQRQSALTNRGYDITCAYLAQNLLYSLGKCSVECMVSHVVVMHHHYMKHTSPVYRDGSPAFGLKVLQEGTTSVDIDQLNLKYLHISEGRESSNKQACHNELATAAPALTNLPPKFTFCNRARYNISSAHAHFVA